MLTQCPHCLTLFRIGPEQLKVAAGKVRCSRCHQVFNALQRLEETPTPFLQNEQVGAVDFWLEEEDLKQPTDDPDSLDRNDDLSGDSDLFASDTPEASPGGDTQAGKMEDANRPGTDEIPDDILAINEHSDFILEQDDGLETEPDYFAEGTESQMSELLDQDSTSELLLDEGQVGGAAEVIEFQRKDDATPDEERPDEEPPPGHDFGDSILKDEEIDQEEGKPDYDSVPTFRANLDTAQQPPATPTDESVFIFEPVETAPEKRAGSLIWTIGSLLLLLLLASQAVWQFRDSLIRHDVGRQVLVSFCSITGCTLPTRRDTDKIIIRDRNLTARPNKPDVLFMHLTMINTATFEQPFPKVQLSLFNDKGKLIARRTFEPAEYLSHSPLKERLMPRSQPIQIEMQLVDPGKEVTGFTFEFL